MPTLAPKYIALGSNKGDRLLELRVAINFLRSLNNNAEPLKSAIYESEPLGPSETSYLNAVCQLDYCNIAPFELLAILKKYELSRGREANAPRWSARSIDLDILFTGKLIVQSQKLTIPHKELMNRNFVLVPLLSLKSTEYGYFSRNKLIQSLDLLPFSRLERTTYSW